MNLILVSSSEIIIGEDGHGRIYLTSDDRRSIHMTNVLKVSVGKELKIGIINSEKVTAVVERVELSAKPKQGVGAQIYLLVQKNNLPLNDSNDINPLKKGLAPLDLVIGLPRPRVFHSILSNATSLGVGRIFFVVCATSDKGYLSSAKLRAQSIMEGLIEGLEQGCDTVLPEVYVYASWERFRREFASRSIFKTEHQLKIVAHPYEKDFPAAKDAAERRFHPDISSLMEVCRAHAKASNNSSVMLAIGPERGFIDSEILTLVSDLGFHGVNLGNRILKVEVALHVLQGAVSDATGLNQDSRDNLGWGANNLVRENQLELTVGELGMVVPGDGYSSKNVLLYRCCGIKDAQESYNEQVERMMKLKHNVDAGARPVLEGLTTLQLPARNWKDQLDKIKENDKKRTSTRDHNPLQN